MYVRNVLNQLQTLLICSILLCGGVHGIPNTEVIPMGRVTWQLYNHCSHGFMQSYMRHVNSKGLMDKRCLTDFTVRVHPSGAIQLQHSLTGIFICFNRRRRLAVRSDGSHRRCFFHEKISETGYTELESVWEPGLYLGFNSKGRFQDPSTYQLRRRCFSFTKYERYVTNSEKRGCSLRTTTAPPQVVDTEAMLSRLLRQHILEQVRARTGDEPL